MREQLQRLIEQRANVWENYQALLARVGDDDFSAEDREALERMDNELNQLGEDIERMERAIERERQYEEVDRSDLPSDDATGETEARDVPRDEAYRNAFETYLRSGSDSLTQEQREALEQGSQRAQGIGTDPAGGYTVPQGFLNRLIESLTAYSGVLQAGAEVIRTDNGQDLPFPTVGVAAKGAILAENTQVTEQDVVFGQKTLKAPTYTSKLVRASIQLIQDSAIDLPNWLESRLTERIGRIQNEHFTTGDGVTNDQPEGIVTGANVGHTTAAGQTASLIWEDFVDLETSVDPAYRANPEDVAWQLNGDTLGAARKLKDGDGRPIWSPSVVSGQPSTLFGYRYVINPEMPGLGAGNKPVVFGNHREAYVVRYVNGVAVARLVERYADYLQHGFLGFQRAHGLVKNADAVKALQNAAV